MTKSSSVRFAVAALFWIGAVLSTAAQELTPSQREDEVNRLMSAQKYLEAAEQAELLLEQIRQRDGAKSSEYRRIRDNLSILYFKAGRLDKMPPAPDEASEPEAPAAPRSEFEELSEQLQQMWWDNEFREAVPLAERIVALAEQKYPESDELAKALHNLGMIHEKLQQLAPAAAALDRAYTLRKRIFPAGHAHIGLTGQWLASVLFDQHEFERARVLYQESLPIREKSKGLEDPEVIGGYRRLAYLSITQKRWADALAATRRVVQAYSNRVDALGSDISIMEPASRAQALDELEQAGQDTTLEAVLSLLTEGNARAPAAAAFERVQLATSSKASTAIASIALRVGPRTDKRLLELIHRRAQVYQDRGGQMGTPLDGEIKRLNEALRTEFPAYSALMMLPVLSVEQVQGLLAANEALVYIVDPPSNEGLPQGLLVWVVTKDQVRWFQTQRSVREVSDDVDVLRCGLDPSASTPSGSKRCGTLLGSSLRPDQPIAFDLGRAHTLYTALFGEAGDLIAGKQLLVAASGALQRLPLQVLVTSKPDPARFGPDALRKASWLVRRQSVTVLPSVSSLEAIRHFSGTSRAHKAMLAFANPAIDGPENDADETLRLRKAAARYRRDCALPLSDEEKMLELRASISLDAAANAGQVRDLTPIPRTAKLVCDIAKEKEFEGSDVFLADRATEQQLRELNESGALANYRIVQFATHGAVAGDVQGLDEPGLILTPPPQGASSGDDGYLSASEIAELHLDADWVILSACNTAAGGDRGGEAFSGLARAFFYANARALLVSHWDVDEQAAVELVTGANRHQIQDHVGRSEALRLAMVDVIEKGSDREVNPSFWAPFVLVGEGGGKTVGDGR